MSLFKSDIQYKLEFVNVLYNKFLEAKTDFAIIETKNINVFDNCLIKKISCNFLNDKNVFVVQFYTDLQINQGFIFNNFFNEKREDFNKYIKIEYDTVNYNDLLINQNITQLDKFKILLYFSLFTGEYEMFKLLLNVKENNLQSDAFKYDNDITKFYSACEKNNIELISNVHKTSLLISY